ncbi:phospholipid phosphatase 2-like isoform X2 [Spodoptera litura]|uniref:Phospholipid phosphatase 2-like isoform X2 n=1 Tax=Spodoptera litura TaxID=69820 RepID=A0A9J7II35_SPOLT|nr:phospholipid phosphatase 2-like isoform X2 [Spodoptera litura]
MLSASIRSSVLEIKRIASVHMRKERRDVESQSSSKTSFCTRHGLWWTFGVDIPLLLILLALIGLFELGVIPNHKAGFYCNDPALNFPFNGDTVTTEILMSTLLAGPLVFFAITEYIFVYVDYSESRIRQTCINTFYLYRTYIYGLIINLSIVEVMKGIVGSPRPTFFDLCEPDAGKTCNGTEYVKDFQCTSTKYASWYQMDSYRSFPSGHTSLSVYCGLFLAWYLQRRAFDWSHRSIFMVPMLQLLCISYAAVCSLTRITDHRHHWWDVLVGTVIGVATVLYAVIISSNFSHDHSKISDLKSQESTQTVRTLLYDERRPATVS